MPSLSAACSVDTPGRLALFWWETQEEKGVEEGLGGGEGNCGWVAMY